MSLNTFTGNTADNTCSESVGQCDLLEQDSSSLDISLPDFVSEFGDELLDSLNRANPPVYTGQARAYHETILGICQQ